MSFSEKDDIRKNKQSATKATKKQSKEERVDLMPKVKTKTKSKMRTKKESVNKKDCSY